MKNTLETRLGLFFALSLIVAFIIMEMVGSFDFFKPGLHVRARFKTVQELGEDDPVKIGGKQIGRVESITLTNNQVEVAIKLTETRRVRTDSEATIRFSGLLGQNYVSLSFGTSDAPFAENGTLLQAIDLPDLGSLMTKLDGVATGMGNLTTNLTGENLQNLVGPLIDFVRENNPRLTAIVSNAQTVSERIVAGQGTVGRLINEDTLYVSTLSAITNFEGTATDIRETVNQAQDLLSTVEGGEGTLGKLAQDPGL
jgi:phospholipid/cholesterol/gamma-HCH transport system substrate-binding protein